MRGVDSNEAAARRRIGTGVSGGTNAANPIAIHAIRAATDA